MAAKGLRRRDGTAGCAVGSQRPKDRFQLLLQGLCFVKSTSGAMGVEKVQSYQVAGHMGPSIEQSDNSE
jgi:predicted secreted Zn-dependent protease